MCCINKVFPSYNCDNVWRLITNPSDVLVNHHHLHQVISHSSLLNFKRMINADVPTLKKFYEYNPPRHGRTAHRRCALHRCPSTSEIPNTIIHNIHIIDLLSEQLDKREQSLHLTVLAVYLLLHTHTHTHTHTSDY